MFGLKPGNPTEQASAYCTEWVDHLRDHIVESILHRPGDRVEQSRQPVENGAGDEFKGKHGWGNYNNRTYIRGVWQQR